MSFTIVHCDKCGLLHDLMDGPCLGCKIIKENKELKAELEQQRFNNKHNLSIDQIVADRIKELEKSNETLNKRCAVLEKRLLNKE